MTPPDLQSELWPSAAPLADRLREAGVLLLTCNESGDITTAPPRGSDWLGDLCGHGRMVRRALRAAAAAWNADKEEPTPIEAHPGLWLVPAPVVSRRRRVAYRVAVIVTDDLLEAEALPALCDSAELDCPLVETMLRRLPPAAAADVPRLALLVGYAHHDLERVRGDALAVESIGKQLAESYEEMNLLYTIIHSMKVVQKPERFIATACAELLETLPYRWIGAQFRDDHQWLKRLVRPFIMAGDAGRPPEHLQMLAHRLLEGAVSDAPMVIEPAANPNHASFMELGRAVLVHPVSKDGQVIGILIAGDKQGDDIAASSVDMKLLGATATHMAIFLENAALYEDLNAMFMGTLEALTASIDAKDRYTSGHSLRVAHLTRRLAVAAGLGEETAARMRIAGLVHDVGKIGVPEAVLTHPGGLSDQQFEWIRRHPGIGYRILKDIPQLSDILPGVLHHHERWDGGGYPNGLRGEAIPLVARMIALADAFDAMSSDRTYRAALGRDEVLREILRESGRQFDPGLAPLFANLDFTAFDRLVIAHRAQEAAEKGEAA